MYYSVSTKRYMLTKETKETDFYILERDLPHACKGKQQGPASFPHKAYQRQNNTSASKLG